MFSELRLGIRSLSKVPGYVAVALATLALGIGVNTAMFSLVRTLLLRPAPYPAAEQLVRVYRTSPQSKTWPHSMPDLDDLRARGRTLASLAAFQWWSFSLAEPGQPAERLRGLVASAELFSTLGVQPVLGRAFTSEEQQPGRDNVVILTDTLWRDRFAADPQIVGRTIRVDGAPRTVIGVMPAAFSYPLFWGRVDAIRPLVCAADWQRERSTHWLGAIARLAPKATLAQAQAELSTLADGLAVQHPETNAGTNIALRPLHETALDDTSRNVSWLTLALAGVVLLIACANLASLQLARSAAHARDLAVRAALGASRSRLMRQILVESALLALTGGALGVLLAVWLNDLLVRRLDLGANVSIPLDWPVLGFALLASFAAALLAGFVPAWLASRTDVNHALKSQARGSTGDRSRHRLRHALIVAEIAFAVVLLAGAAFFVRGLQRLAARDPGWHAADLLVATLTLPDTLPSDRYRQPEVKRAFYDRLLQRVAALPGVEHAALSSALPIQSYSSSRNIAIEGRADPVPGQEPLADHVFVSPDLFDTIGLQLVAGRALPENARADGPRVAVINETMARQFWPGENPIGRRFGSADPQQRDWIEIVGVVRDVGFVANVGLPDTRLQIYRPLAQEPWGYLTLALRTSQPESLAEPLRRAVAEIDPDLPVADIRTVRQAVERGHRNFQVANELLGGFAFLGLALAALGLYGVIATLVAQRTQEFGVRLALGAPPRRLLWLVLGRSLVLAAFGVGLGLGGAMVLMRFLAHLVPGVPGNDPLALAGVGALLLAVALLACWFPARRATRVDPMVALRAE